MSMNPIPRKISDDDQKLIDEYLKNGGTVTVKERGERSEEIEYTNGFRKSKKKNGSS